LRRPRILFAQPSLQPPGGGQGVAAWMLEALRDEYDVTVLTAERVDFEAINRFFGTSLSPSDVVVHPVLTRTFRLARLVPLPLALLRDSLFRRATRRLVDGFDVVMSAANESDFGRPGIQYIHYPWNFRPRPVSDLRWYHARPLLRAYYRLSDWISRFSREGVRRNLTLVNSDWTGVLVTGWYGIPTSTLYPPVASSSSGLAWEHRENGFVCIGRISPEKELDRVIDIVGAVRRRVPGVRLHLVGTPGRRAYYRRIMRRAREHADWVSIRQGLSRRDLAQLIGSQRYGLHGMREEHSGMAPAEMVLAGCIVWVPDGGGQTEIVDGAPSLTYHSVDDAVAKILHTLGDPEEQTRLRASLAGRRDLFSAERFTAAVRRIVADFIAGTPPSSQP
jgi:glycosyltransferase involved in cell wall biosynthesis